MSREYYKAYDERYKTAHSKGVQWFGGTSTKIVPEILKKYGVGTEARMLEIGCGEGRDSAALLNRGHDLLATDVSSEAIACCRRLMPEYAERFAVLDCLDCDHPYLYDFIFAVGVVHMLVEDRDRNGFYHFIRGHLTDGGIALVCSMGDGESEMQTDAAEAFDLRVRHHETGDMTVAATSYRRVSFPAFEAEIAANGLEIVEKGIETDDPEYGSLMYAVVKKAADL